MTSPRPVRARRDAEEPVRERTGRTWDEWFGLLDAWGAVDRTHTEIARHLTGELAVDGWWAQSITVAYEQERGLRTPGQSRDGLFTAGVSRTVEVPVETLFAAFADAETRSRWLPEPVSVRRATVAKVFRVDWADGTRVAVFFTPKGESKSHVAVSHEKLPDAESAAAMKAFWARRLDGLKKELES